MSNNGQQKLIEQFPAGVEVLAEKESIAADNPLEAPFIRGKVVKMIIPPAKSKDQNIRAEISGDDGKTYKIIITNLSRICQGKEINVDDMAEVSPVNVTDLLNNIQNRYDTDEIFTMVGDTLIIVNPYYLIPGLYAQERMDNIIKATEEKTLLGFNKYVKGKPHVYDTTMNTIFDLIASKKNQALVISGESGAGKTECAKLCMKFIAYFFGNRNKSDDGPKEVSLEDKILACNPVLEAFGNAKTVRNNNSSRFGKYIKIFVNIVDKKIVGAFMETYLLEKSRVCIISKDERDYHIFYQIIAGLNALIKNKFNYDELFSNLEKQKLKLQETTKQYIRQNLVEENIKFWLGQDTLKEATFSEYNYVAQGETTVPGIDDVFNLYEMIEGLIQTNFKNDEINYVFRTTMGVLLIGNIDFEQKGDKCEFSAKSVGFMDKACKLLDIEKSNLEKGFLYSTRTIAGKVYDTPLKLEDCRSYRDTFAKEIYNRIFLFLKDKMNLTLFDESQRDKLENDPDIKHIGLLDIFGFECFKENSFEQFCINYANEKLQNLYVEDIFKEIENMFIREGLKEHFKQIEFKDNQNILDAMGKKPVGIFFKLDDVCLGPGEDNVKKDGILFSKVSGMEKDMTAVKKSIKNPNCFFIIHTAKDVEYSIAGFCTKNLDEFKVRMVEAVNSIKDPMITKMIGEEDEAKKANKEKSLGGKFRTDMDNLAHALRECVRHYIRCLKPNEKKRKHYFEPYFSLQQIKYMGVLDTIRIRQEGYPIVKDLFEFYKRYEDAVDFSGKLFINKVAEDNPEIPKWNQNIVNALMKDQCGPEKILFGKTKILMKQKFYDDIDKSRAEHIKVKEDTVTKITLKYRGIKPHQQFNKFYKAIYTLQQNYKLFDYMNRINKYREICNVLQNKAKENAIKEYSKNYFEKIKKIGHAIVAEKYRQKFKKAYIKKLQTKYVILNYVKSFKHKKFLKYRNTVHNILMKRVNKYIDSLYVPTVTFLQKHVRTYLWKLHQGGVYDHIVQRRGVLKEEIRAIKIQKNFKRYFLSKQVKIMRKAVTNFIGLYRYYEFHKSISEKKKAAIIIQRAYKRRFMMRKIIQTNLREFSEQENELYEEANVVTSANLFPNQKPVEKNEDGEIIEQETDEEEEKVKKSYEKLLRNVNPAAIKESSYLNHSAYDEPKLYFFAHILDLDPIINLDDVYTTPWSETFQEVVNHNIQQNTPIQIIEIGESHTALINSSGKAFAWGWNGNGQCAFRSKLDANFIYDDFKVFQKNQNNNMVKMNIEDSPMEIDGGINEDFDFDEELNYIKEENEYFSNVDEAEGGFTQNDFENFYYLQSPMILDNYNISKITCGDDFTMALDSERGLCVFGANYDYQLGVLKNRNIYDPVTFTEICKAQGCQVNTKSKIIDMKTSGKNNILINDEGSVILLSCNRADNGELLNRTPMEIKVPNAKFANVECGKDFCLLLTVNGMLYTFGDNHYGQLGLGDYEKRNAPTCVKYFIDNRIKVFQISCGYKHASAKGPKQAYCWGCNAYGQLGTGNLRNMPTPTLTEIKSTKIGSAIIQVSCGFRCTTFLTENRKVYWCGTSGDLRRQTTPIEFNYASKVPEIFSLDNHQIVKINHSWSRTMSIMYATIAETAPLKLKLNNNIKLNYLLNSLTSKWTSKDLYAPRIEHMDNLVADKHMLKIQKGNANAKKKKTKF